MLKLYARDKSQSALIRRWDEDFKGIRGANMFSDIVENGELNKLFDGEYNGITYYRHAWYLTKNDETTGKPIKEFFSEFKKKSVYASCKEKETFFQSKQIKRKQR